MLKTIKIWCAENWHSYLFAFVAIGLMIFIIVMSHSFQNCVQCSQYPYGNQSEKECLPVFSVSFGNYLTCIGSTIDQNQGALTALATFIIAIFTIKLAKATNLLWRSGEKQLQLTKDALVADKRAFVFAVGLMQYWERDSQTGLYNWRFRPQWRNSGDTPTKNMRMNFECVVRDSPLPAGFDLDHAAIEPGTGLLAPKDQMFGGLAPRGNPITPQDIIDTQAGTKFIYVWGWIRYFDVFPDSPRHITRFCWQILPAGNPHAFMPDASGVPPSPGTVSFSFLHHTEGNCADDECN